MHPSTQRSGGAVRLDSLTSMRFFAAALVVGVHVGYLFHNPQITHGLQRGGSGVSFFFVLSGFVLAWTARNGDTARAFYRRRFARIYPTHALSWLLALSFIAGLNAVGYIKTGHPSSAGLLASLSLVQAWVPRPSVYFAGNGVSWSLSCELFFYALFPFLAGPLRKLGRPSQLGLVGALCGLVLLLHLPADTTSSTWVWVTQVLPAVRLLEFVVGVLLAHLMAAGWRPRMGLAPAVVLSALTLCLAVALPLNLTVPIMLPAYALLICAGAAHDLGGHKGVLSNPLFVKLGEWSFALYMVHMLWVQPVLSHGYEGRLGIASGVLLSLLLAAASLATAAAVHELWEKPWERRLRGAPGSASEPASEWPSPLDAGSVASGGIDHPLREESVGPL